MAIFYLDFNEFLRQSNGSAPQTGNAAMINSQAYQQAAGGTNPPVLFSMDAPENGEFQHHLDQYGYRYQGYIGNYVIPSDLGSFAENLEPFPNGVYEYQGVIPIEQQSAPEQEFPWLQDDIDDDGYGRFYGS